MKWTSIESLGSVSFCPEKGDFENRFWVDQAAFFKPMWRIEPSDILC
jgi:hypothetical protein